MESIRLNLPGTPAIYAAMQRDIDVLRRESPIQQQSDDTYANLRPKTMIVVEYVNEQEIKFLDRPQVFEGNYAGRFCPMWSYPYYEEADIGGKRYYIVQDNFGVWLGFRYTVPI